MTIRGAKLNTGYFTENKKSKILYHRGALNICTNTEPPTTFTDHSCLLQISFTVLKQASIFHSPVFCVPFSLTMLFHFYGLHNNINL